jgi:GT2 family glycosyltransferase
MIAVKRIVNAENLGVAGSLRLGLAACSYKRIARMDSDDIMVLDRLEKQMAWLDDHPEAVMVGAQMIMFKDDNPGSQTATAHPVRIDMDTFTNPNPDILPHGKFWIMNHPTLMFRKSAILEVGNYNPDYDGIEDYELELRILQKFGVLYNIPEALVLYRLHPSQSSKKVQDKLAKLESCYARLISQ